MKDKRKDIKEPYEPQDTPEPPQIKEPHRDREHPVQDSNRPDARNAEKTGQKETKEEQKDQPHLMSDEAEIDDETTI